ERLAPIGRSDDVVTAPLEDPACKLTHTLLILDEQDRLGPAVLAGGRNESWRVRVRVLFRARQQDRDLRALARSAAQPHVTSALLHDAVDRRQTEARPLTRRLRREERLE